MKIKKIVGTSLLIMSMSSVPLLAHADLKITNYTYKDLTSIINDGACSSWLGDIGITKARVPGGNPVEHPIPTEIIQFACAHEDPKDTSCKADVFTTNNCGPKGQEIATVYFDVNTGIKYVEQKSKEYTISGTGFDIKVEGGPVPSGK